MTTTDIVITIVLVALSSGLFGFFVGWGRGVTDTEQRWSDAVKMKEGHDRWKTTQS